VVLSKAAIRLDSQSRLNLSRIEDLQILKTDPRLVKYHLLRIVETIPIKGDLDVSTSLPAAGY
jgi:hypothetical protein